MRVSSGADVDGVAAQWNTTTCPEPQLAGSLATAQGMVRNRQRGSPHQGHRQGYSCTAGVLQVCCGWTAHLAGLHVKLGEAALGGIALQGGRAVGAV